MRTPRRSARKMASMRLTGSPGHGAKARCGLRNQPTIGHRRGESIAHFPAQHNARGRNGSRPLNDKGIRFSNAVAASDRNRTFFDEWRMARLKPMPCAKGLGQGLKDCDGSGQRRRRAWLRLSLQS